MPDRSAAASSNGHAASRVVSGAAARRAAGQIDIGNMIAVLVPLPLLIFWLGLSMLIYALHRHHPNPLVGRYIQHAAYRLYGVMGAVVPVATFFPGDGLTHWLVAWAIAAAVLIPWSILALLRIRRDQWDDVPITTEDPALG